MSSETTDERDLVDHASLRQAIRSSGRRARQELSGAARQRAEAAIVSHLRTLDTFRRGPVGVFVADDGEPDLSALVHWLWAREVEVALPALADDPADFSMHYRPWRAGDTLIEGRFGIPIPPDAERTVPATVLVALTGFDATGNRIGRGGGFFDRYLATADAAIIGVGFEVQRFATIPIEPHDIGLPTMVSDLGVRFWRD